MPYVRPDQRDRLDGIVDFMNYVGIRADGDLNYVLFAFCKRHVTPGYRDYKSFCGELRQCATEIERRLLGPLEDKKIEENGDVE